MHIYFSGIGGTGIGPLALIAHQAGFTVSGSDKQDSGYITYLRKQGITNIHIGQSTEAILAVHQQNPIDWFVYSSALPKEQPQHPELVFTQEHDIKHTKRDEFLNYLLREKGLKLLAVAGTHGKTTTTAMLIWMFQQMQLPASYSVGAKLSFGDMGHFDPSSEYFLYECDEYDRNFLSFSPHLAILSGIDWDHADIYPTRESYYEAFRQFIDQSERVVLWRSDAERLGLVGEQADSKWADKLMIIEDDEPALEQITLAGEVNRRDALEVLWALRAGSGLPLDQLVPMMNQFPGVTRRFEQLRPSLYTDYAHTPKKIEGALQLAQEVAEANRQKLTVVYEGLHNTRQHFIKDDLQHLFDAVDSLFVVPSYLAREDPSLELLTPQAIIDLTSKKTGVAADLNDQLKQHIQQELAAGNLVLCLSAGGGGSLDEWLRREF